MEEIRDYDKKVTCADLYAEILSLSKHEPGYSLTNLPTKSHLLKTLKHLKPDHPYFRTDMQIIRRAVPKGEQIIL